MITRGVDHKVQRKTVLWELIREVEEQTWTPINFNLQLPRSPKINYSPVCLAFWYLHQSALGVAVRTTVTMLIESNNSKEESSPLHPIIELINDLSQPKVTHDFSRIASLLRHHHFQHRLGRLPARSSAIDLLSQHTKLHWHLRVLPLLLDVRLLLRRAEREAVVGSLTVRDTLRGLVVAPPRGKQALNILRFVEKRTKCGNGVGLIIVDGTNHGVPFDVESIFLLHAQHIDEDVEGLLL